MSEATVDHDSPRVVETARGTGWWRDAWTLFRRSPGAWIVLGVISIALLVLLSLIPLLGSLVASLISPALAGGWMLAAHKAEGGGVPGPDDLFAGFREKLRSLLIQGAIVVAASAITALVVAGLGANALIGVALGGGTFTPETLLTALSAAVLALIVGLAMSVVLAMAIWYAPALVVFRDAAPFDAMKASFAATLRNTVPFLLYGLVFIVLAIVASIPLGLGWIVLGPLLALSVYVSYRDIFGA